MSVCVNTITGYISYEYTCLYWNIKYVVNENVSFKNYIPTSKAVVMHGKC